MTNTHRRNKRRQFNLKRRKVLAKKRRRREAKKRRLRKIPPQKITLHIPRIFCFIADPERVNEFIALMRYHIEMRHTVDLNFENVDTIGSDAIIMLLAHTKDPKLEGYSKITGNMPKKVQPAQVLKQSGFFDHVHLGHRFGPPTGRIQRRKGKRVDAKVITEMIGYGSLKLFGERRKMKGVYRIYVEAMANTHDHASATAGEIEQWWTAVYFDEAEKKVVFTLVDTGVGIFRSAKLRFIQDTAMIALGFRNHADVLYSIMEGNIGSRTGIPFRGKGLPAMKKVFDRRQICNLVVAANDAMINYETHEIRLLSIPVHGTVISWEYNASCI